MIQAYADKVKIAQDLIDKYFEKQVSADLSHTSLFNDAGYNISQEYEIDAPKVGFLNLSVLDIAAASNEDVVYLGIVVNGKYSLFNINGVFELVQNNSLSFGYKRGAV